MTSGGYPSYLKLRVRVVAYVSFVGVFFRQHVHHQCSSFFNFFLRVHNNSYHVFPCVAACELCNADEFFTSTYRKKLEQI